VFGRKGAFLDLRAFMKLLNGFGRGAASAKLILCNQLEGLRSLRNGSLPAAVSRSVFLTAHGTEWQERGKVRKARLAKFVTNLRGKLGRRFEDPFRGSRSQAAPVVFQGSTLFWGRSDQLRCILQRTAAN